MDSQGLSKPVDSQPLRPGCPAIPLAPEEMSDLLGLSQGQVAQVLSRLEAKGIIRCTDQGIEVLDAARLCARRGSF